MCPGNMAVARPPYGTTHPRLTPCSREISSWLRKSVVWCGNLSSFTVCENPKPSLAPVHSLVTWHSSLPLVKLQQVQMWQPHLMFQQLRTDIGNESSKIKTSFWWWWQHIAGPFLLVFWYHRPSWNSTQISLKRGWNYTSLLTSRMKDFRSCWRTPWSQDSLFWMHHFLFIPFHLFFLNNYTLFIHISKPSSLILSAALTR